MTYFWPNGQAQKYV